MHNIRNRAINEARTYKKTVRYESNNNGILQVIEAYPRNKSQTDTCVLLKITENNKIIDEILSRN